MARVALRLVIAAALVGTGWIVGRAQAPTTPTPDFEISIVAPAGRTTVACVRGCEFGISQLKDGVTRHGRIPSFSSGCGPNAGPTCELRAFGWVLR